ncbi:hypothetical protein [Staphylococcus equorum]|uniref:hypothetical protein n=1 Tax=Staphylococcus equorum TaxID=246432 RepID=UPI003FD720EF
MFDTINDIIGNLMEPIGETARTVILVVAFTLLAFVIIMILYTLTKQKWGAMIILIVVAIGLGVFGTQGYNVMKSLGEQQGDDFKGQLNSVFALGAIPTYLMHRKYKKKTQNNES